MKIITKKRLTISLGLLSLTALLVWYFLPFLSFKWLMFRQPEIAKYMNVSPRYIENLPETPSDWTAITLGNVDLKLPIQKYFKIVGEETFIHFYSKSGSLAIFDIAEPKDDLSKMVAEGKIEYPYVGYNDELAFLTHPSDFSIFNSRKKNNENLIYLNSKASWRFSELRILNSNVLKAICIISEKEEGGFGAYVYLYSPNEKRYLGMALMRYKTKEEMTSDLLNLLSGMTLPNQPPDAEKVSKDINSIVKKYNRTEQNAQPDSQ